jgi:hypothetical protein
MARGGWKAWRPRNWQLKGEEKQRWDNRLGGSKERGVEELGERKVFARAVWC